MTEKWDQSLDAQITSKMHELIGCMCVVTFKPEGDRRGMIERIEALTLGKDFPESFERSQFGVHLTSGDIVVVPGSAISAIESATAGSRSTKIKKKPGMKTRKPGRKRCWPKSVSQSRRRPRKAQQRLGHGERKTREHMGGRRANERGPRI